MGRKARFSLEQDADIARLYADDRLTLQQIAGRLGTNKSPVRNSLLRSGVTIRPRSSPRPSYEWVACACGRRAAYKTGQCVRCYNRERNRDPATKERKFNWWLMVHYGLTRDAYDAMLERQNGVCAVCRKPDSRGARLAVDHDHSCCPGEKTCGKCLRGLLCLNCNTALGSLKEDVRNVESLLAYLTA